MERNGRPYHDWTILGPRALSWLAAEAPRRATLLGLMGDCRAAMDTPDLTYDRLSSWLRGSAHAQWTAIKRTVGTGEVPGPAPHPVDATGAFTGSMKEFAMAEKRRVCPVCALPPAVRAELRDPKNQDIKVDQRLRYIAAATGVTLSRAEYEAHRNERHDV